MITQAAAKYMVANRDVVKDSGSIINISSIFGKTGNIGQCNYTASKAGVVGFTKSAAKELARYNVRCNAIMPAVFGTPMAETVPEKLMNEMKKQMPLGRMGRVQGKSPQSIR